MVSVLPGDVVFATFDMHYVCDRELKVIDNSNCVSTGTLLLVLSVIDDSCFVITSDEQGETVTGFRRVTDIFRMKETMEHRCA